MLTAYQQRQQQDNFVIDPPRHVYLDFKISGTQQVLAKLATIDCRNLETLNLAHTNVDDSIIDTLIDDFVNKEETQLRELDLSGNNLSDHGVKRLLEAIDTSSHCQLRKLNISGNPEVSANMQAQVAQNFSSKPTAFL